MMISTRYVPAICVLLAVAIIPTIIHSYSPSVSTDTTVKSTIPTAFGEYQSVPSERDASWGDRRFNSDDWMEREYRSPSGDRLRLTVVTSFDAKSVYHHPELAVAYRTTFAGEETHRFAQRPEIPVHVLKPGPAVRARAVYALHYDTRFIDDPVAFQIRTAAELLFSRRKPMTLFFVLDPEADLGDAEQSSAVKLLFEAIGAFLSHSTS